MLGGLKTDLLCLKTLLTENMPEVYNKLIYIGVPIDYFFGETLMLICSDILPCETMFRLLDLCVLE